MKPKVIAVGVSDIHLSLRPPIARSGEDNWFKAMARPLLQLKAVAEEHKAPIVCAGDVFHKWDSRSELVNFAMSYMPQMYAIPGQHDLPFHRYDDIRKSSYWTLVKAGLIKPLPPGKGGVVVQTPSGCPLLRLFGFPWGFPPEPQDPTEHEELCVAVVHAYVWHRDASYPGAPSGSNLKSFRLPLKGYQAAIFGDNHKPFCAPAGLCNVFNHGGFMRRNSDEVEHKPALGLLMSDGTWQRHYLDTSEEKIDAGTETKSVEAEQKNAEEFVKDLKRLGHTSLDFVEAVNVYLKTHKVSKSAQRILTEALND